ncbi:hypothetical protein [Mycobacteroides abscessus]|uniref:hypothetical protein n=1 Tax=Mycobacteroides abscessus TaxID=36809 RepID=UPI0019D2AD53|nr:hypothetical protein [Mycobacteroides abscessus]MBN7457557.1 hypothetical protein [Mycobacteroides abscessus subsp. abscessus]
MSTDWRGVILRELVIRAGGTLAFADPSRSVREALAELSAEGVIAWDGTRARLTYAGLTALEPYPRSVVVVGMARVMRALEDAPDHRLPEGSISWDGELGSNAPGALRAAVDHLRGLGIVKRTSSGMIFDATGEVSRVARKSPPPQFPSKPKAPAPVVKAVTPTATVKAAPAPAPAPTAPVPVKQAAPVAPTAPTAPVPVKQAEPVVKEPTAPATVDVITTALTQALTDALTTVLTKTTAPSSSEGVVHELRQLREGVTGLVGQGRLEPSAPTIEYRNRLTLARRITVLLAAHGPLSKSALIRTKLSSVQAETLTDALEFLIGVGAVRVGERRRYTLVDAELVGLTQTTLDAEVQRIRARAAQRAANEANRAIAAHRDKVLAG